VHQPGIFCILVLCSWHEHACWLRPAVDEVDCSGS
jgi:hypothetical protein